MGSICCCGGGKKAAVSPVIQPRVPSMKSTVYRPDYSAMDRCNKITLNDTDPLLLIDGYLNEPLVSLEEALQPFHGKIHNLSDHIKTAKTECHFPNEHGLTRDESAAIYIYTMKWGDGCLYDRLQEAWASKDKSHLRPWFRYLRLFKSALDKLPTTKSEVWQGKLYDPKLKDKLNAKSGLFYSSLGSCALSQNEIKDYLQKDGHDNCILLGYGPVDGKVVSGYCASKSKEVILWPGVKVGVASFHENHGDGFCIYHMVKHTDPPPPLKSKTPMPTPTPTLTPKPTEKHFRCRNKEGSNLCSLANGIVERISCSNRCRLHHELGHCYGFDYI